MGTFNQTEMATIYVLKLEDDCRYVGKSDRPDIRMANHFLARGAWWTRKHKPIEIEAMYHSTSGLDEDRITEELMMKHGIDKVRGAHT